MLNKIKNLLSENTECNCMEALNKQVEIFKAIGKRFYDLEKNYEKINELIIQVNNHNKSMGDMIELFRINNSRLAVLEDKMNHYVEHSSEVINE